MLVVDIEACERRRREAARPPAADEDDEDGPPPPGPLGLAPEEEAAALADERVFLAEEEVEGAIGEEERWLGVVAAGCPVGCLKRG